MYSKATAWARLTDGFSDKIPVRKGMHQGDTEVLLCLKCSFSAPSTLRLLNPAYLLSDTGTTLDTHAPV